MSLSHSLAADVLSRTSFLSLDKATTFERCVERTARSEVLRFYLTSYP